MDLTHIVIIVTFIICTLNVNSEGWIVANRFDYEDVETIYSDTSDETDISYREKDDTRNSVNYDDYTIERPLTNQNGYYDIVVSAHEKHDQDLYVKLEYSRKKRQDNNTQITVDEELQIRVRNGTKLSNEEYDYDNFKAEYDYQIELEQKRIAEVNRTEYQKQNITCNASGFFDVGIGSIKCLLYKLKTGTPMREIYPQLTWIIKFWLFIILTIYGYCFCHLGYMRCCCPCRICFPEDILEETKQYIVLNPPGVIKFDERPEYYKPTEMEIYFYTRLWNKIYRAI